MTPVAKGCESRKMMDVRQRYRGEHTGTESNSKRML